MALKEERCERKKLEAEVKDLHEKIERMKSGIQCDGIEVNESMDSDIKEIMDTDVENVSPFVKLFWEQQKVAFANSNVRKYNPMIICFCLSLAAKSSSAYDELRDSKVLTLPSRRTLRDYRNAIRPSVGFTKAVIDELVITAKPLKGHQRYVTLAFDEMKIKENLVFDKNTNELIGYVDIGDPELNYGTSKNVEVLATHIFIYLVRGVSSDLKFSLAYFATNTMGSCQIMSTFWEAVGIFELTCNLYVIAAVSDGAPSNRRFYDNHHLMDDKPIADIVHRTINMYAPGRYIWFFADAPHLLKTTRNCIYNSGDGKARNMWNDGKRIIWTHLWTVVNDELMNGLKLDSSLSFDHVNLNPYSKMNVRLATQILSNKVSIILKNYYPEEMHATAELCGMMNCFLIALMGEAKWRVFIKEMKWYCHSVMSMISDFHGCLIHS